MPHESLSAWTKTQGGNHQQTGPKVPTKEGANYSLQEKHSSTKHSIVSKALAYQLTSLFVTFRKPKAIVYKSKDASGNGSFSALPSTNPNFVG
jgi:hypothetical protein